MRRLAVLFVTCLAACSATAPDAVAFDPCQRTEVSATGASADQLASIDDAIARWQALGVQLARSDAGAIAIEFRAAAPALFGAYEDATVVVNAAITDPDARAIVIAHELGHALALVHVAPVDVVSVMNPGNLSEPPNAADAAALVARWGHCAD